MDRRDPLKTFHGGIIILFLKTDGIGHLFFVVAHSMITQGSSKKSFVLIVCDGGEYAGLKFCGELPRLAVIVSAIHEANVGDPFAYRKIPVHYLVCEEKLLQIGHGSHKGKALDRRAPADRKGF